MAKDVQRHYKQCIKCQQAKQTKPQRAPLINVPIGRPWQMVAVDILEVPLSRNNNRYLMQDYFTKWADAIPLPDQTARRISSELVKLFSTLGPPQVLHSDQGRNFESALLAQTLQAFGISKSRTSAYHPQGDGLVERFNRSLLQLLRTYVERQEEWEQFLPLLLYAYRTSVHYSTGVSPFTLMYGRNPSVSSFSPVTPTTAFDSTSYPAYLQAKLAVMYDFVETNLAAAADRQKAVYDQHSSEPHFAVGDPVWLSIPTAGKLDPRWEGRWSIMSIKSPVNMEISDGKRIKVVHSNRLRHRIQPDPSDPQSLTPLNTSPSPHWEAPTVEHFLSPPTASESRRYPQRERRPPVRLQF